MGGTREKLLNSSFVITTAEKYKSMWNMFLEYLLDQDLDMTLDSLCLYVEYLFEDGLSYSTIRGHMSGIAYYLNLYSLPDLTKHFIITQMLRGVKNLHYEPDVRLPFTEENLKDIIDVIRRGVKDVYLKFLYCALFSWAFYACLRSSEYADCKYTDHLLKLGDIHRFKVGSHGAYRIRFRTFKHSPSTFPDLVLHKTGDIDSCPVRQMDIYLSLRPSGDPDEPLFVDSTGAISRYTIGANLNKCLQHLGLSQTKYKLHSFRIGRATMWAQLGYNEIQIKAMGRWFSNAYQRYIRDLVILQ